MFDHRSVSINHVRRSLSWSRPISRSQAEDVLFVITETMKGTSANRPINQSLQLSSSSISADPDPANQITASMRQSCQSETEDAFDKDESWTTLYVPLHSGCPCGQEGRTRSQTRVYVCHMDTFTWDKSNTDLKTGAADRIHDRPGHQRPRHDRTAQRLRRGRLRKPRRAKTKPAVFFRLCVRQERVR